MRDDCCIVYFSLVILLLITPLSGLPLTKVTEEQLKDESNKKPLLLGSSTSVTNNDTLQIETNKTEHLTANTYDKPVLSNNTEHVKSGLRATLSSTPDPWYTTTGSYRPTNDNDTPWYIYVIVVFFVLCFCCGGCAGTSKAKTGRWVPVRVWVDD